MEIKELAKMVANDFARTMKEKEFKTFEEMSQYFAWNKEDVKNEVLETIRLVGAYPTEYNTKVCLGDDIISYRKFEKLWRSYMG